MKMFLHTPERIRIVNDALFPAEFECTPDVYSIIEPDYPQLAEGMSGRYWTPENAYTTDGQSNYPETFDGTPFCQRVDAYQLPCIYAALALSQDRIRIDDPEDGIDFSAALQDADGNVLPVEKSWIIRLRDADGEEVDAFEVQFTAGHTPVLRYSCPPGVSLGRIHVDENDFIPVDVPGVGTFQVKLFSPVEFTIYRQLQEV